jgi:hypothetical protein
MSDAQSRCQNTQNIVNQLFSKSILDSCNESEQ